VVGNSGELRPTICGRRIKREGIRYRPNLPARRDRRRRVSFSDHLRADRPSIPVCSPPGKQQLTAPRLPKSRTVSHPHPLAAMISKHAPQELTRRSVRFPGREGRGRAAGLRFRDGVPLSPEEYSQLLAPRSTAGADSAADDYRAAACPKKLEARMAAMLEKGRRVAAHRTLANHLCGAIARRIEAAGAGPGESHLYNDCGDCCQTLSGSTWFPLRPARRPSHWSKPSRLATFPCWAASRRHRSSADRDSRRRRSGNASTRRMKSSRTGRASAHRACIWTARDYSRKRLHRAIFRPRVRRAVRHPSTFRCTSISTRGQRCRS